MTGTTDLWRRRLVLVGLAFAVTIAGFASTVADMVGIWWTSSTFNHCFLIPPIAIYMAATRWDEVTAAAPATSLWAVPALLAAGLLWLCGTVVSIAFFQHVAFVTAIIALFWALAGDRAARLLMFPLAYLYFCVPEGEFLVPHLQDITAEVLVHMLRLSNIPVFIEGRYLAIPSGNFVVAEACSGINYLIATLAVGTMFMYLRFERLSRRLAFLALAITVPIVANGLRAYGIVMIAHYSDYKYALGIDHFIYGWVFFGLVIFALFAVGNLFSDVDDAALHPAPRTAPSDRASGMRAETMLVIALALLLAPRGALHVLDRQRNPGPEPLLPVPAAWSAPQPAVSILHPIHEGASVLLAGTYEGSAGTVTMEVAYYPAQEPGSELVSQLNQPFDPGRVQQLDYGSRSVELPGGILDIAEVEVRTANGEYLVWHWNEIGGVRTTNRIRAKIAEAAARITGRSTHGAFVALVTRTGTDTDAATRLREFLAALDRTRWHAGAPASRGDAL